MFAKKYSLKWFSAIYYGKRGFLVKFMIESIGRVILNSNKYLHK